MPELARNRRTSTIHVAAELPFSPELDTGGWECPGCRVEMIPVAASGAQQYKVAPHFRIHGIHDEDCSAVGQSSRGSGGGSTPGEIASGPPATFPKALRLSVARQEGDTESGATAASAASIGSRQAGIAHLQRGSASIAGSLHRIVESYLLSPEHHAESLRIDGCEGSSYETCFRQLQKTRRPLPLPRLVWFAEIQFRHIIREGDVATLSLAPVEWIGSGKTGPCYRIRFDTRAWTPRRRSAMLAEVERQRAEQQRLHHAKAAERVNIFFFGRQDHDDLMLFHLEDPRLACFFLMPKA